MRKGLFRRRAIKCLQKKTKYFLIVVSKLKMESVLRKAGVLRNRTIFYKSVQLLAYADDIDIICRTMQYVSAAFSGIERQSAKVGLAFNEGKTKYMLSTSGDVPRRSRLTAIISRLSRSLYTLAPPLTQTMKTAWKSSAE